MHIHDKCECLLALVQEYPVILGLVGQLQKDQKDIQKVDPNYPKSASKDIYEPTRNREDPGGEYLLQLITDGHFDEDSTYARFLQTLGKNLNSPYWTAAEQGEATNGQKDKG